MSFSEHANFPNREESIRDRLVLGVRDRELSEKLQLQANLTLKDAVQQARQFELVKHQLSEQRHDSSTSVDAVTHRPSGSSAPRQVHNHGPRGGARTKKPDYNSYKGGNEGRACTNCPRGQLRGRNVGPAENPTTLNKYAALQGKSVSQRSTRRTQLTQ